MPSWAPRSCRGCAHRRVRPSCCASCLGREPIDPAALFLGHGHRQGEPLLGRLLAAPSLDWSEVPITQLEHLTEEQVQAYRIVDNRLTEISVWDDSLLAEQLKALSALELDFSIDVIGFAMGEIDLRIEGLEAAPDEKDPGDILPSRGRRAIPTYPRS